MDKQETLNFIRSFVSEAGAVTASLAEQGEEILSIVDALYEVVSRKGRIFTCGNGGSACDAMHMAEELVARYLRERPGIRAQHLIDSGTITCWANDYSFDSCFRRQVETLMDPEDALIGFTTSGNSENVLQALEAANKIGGLTVAFTGKSGGRAKNLAKHILIVRSEITSHIQQAHMAMVHVACDLLEQRLYPESV